MALVVLLAALACGRRPVLVRDTRLRMGTMLTVAVWGRDSIALERALGQAFDSVRMLDSLLSTYQEHSEITRINRNRGSAQESASVPFAAVLGEALAVAQASKGAFDPTLRDWRRVRFDRVTRVVRLEPGLTLDFGGIAKGYALDRAALPLAGAADSAVLDFGGQLLFVGRSKAVERGRGRRVGIADPDAPGRLVAVIEVESGSVSTSSQAQRPGHIIDPRTGEPATRARSVTVVATTGIVADAWSTGFFVLGCDSALALAPALRVDVLCVDRSVRWSAGLDGRVALARDSAAGSAAPSRAHARGPAWAARRSTRRS